jgi:glycine cleavage system aminomethyltransferase T
MELRVEEKVVGRVTSAVFSSRMNSNIGLAMIKRGYNDIGASLLASNAEVKTQARVLVLPA